MQEFFLVLLPQRETRTCLHLPEKYQKEFHLFCMLSKECLLAIVHKKDNDHACHWCQSLHRESKTDPFNTFLKLLTIHSNKGHRGCSCGMKDRICCITEITPFIRLCYGSKSYCAWIVNSNSAARCNQLIVVKPINCDLNRKTERRNTGHADRITNNSCLIGWILTKIEFKVWKWRK